MACGRRIDATHFNLLIDELLIRLGSIQPWEHVLLPRFWLLTLGVHLRVVKVDLAFRYGLA